MTKLFHGQKTRDKKTWKKREKNVKKTWKKREKKCADQLMTKLVKGDELDADFGKIWSLCRTIFIPKEVVNKKVISYRPIGITSCWYRLP